MTNRFDRPIALIILDGWGVAQGTEGNAIAQAYTPFYDEICARYPSTTLAASGDKVGLAAGTPGNAEAGHLNIGTGRVVHTEISRITESLLDNTFFTNPVLEGAIRKAAKDNRPLHLIGTLSDAGVHSSLDGLYALLRMAKSAGVKDVFVHCILDGRDVMPRTADVYVEALEIKMADIGVGRIASLCGRFFGMDSGEHWERTARAFTMMVHGEGERVADAATAVRNSFLRGIADEFIAPIVIEDEPGVPAALIGEGDTVVFFNHRSDTMRQLARFLAVPDHGSATVKPKIEAVCMTEYDKSFGLPVAYPPEQPANVLGNVLKTNNVPNLRIAEHDRFRHVTSFFNGGDATFPYEQHLLVRSAQAYSRVTEPEMESFKIADRFVQTIEKEPAGVFTVNLSASDIVAETGDLEKTIEAVQFVDTCLGGIVEKLRDANGIAIITSSHGNCEQMFMPDSEEPRRSPTSNPVPFHIISDSELSSKLKEGGSLQDVAPTLLGLMGIPKPDEMTGSDLRAA